MTNFCKCGRDIAEWENICIRCLDLEITREVYGVKKKMDKKEPKLPSFIEARTVEEANQVNMTHYSFVRFSDSRNRYIFKRRERI